MAQSIPGEAPEPFGGPAAGGEDAERHAARIRALDAAWAAAAARRDLDGMMAIYAPDARELLPDLAPIVGRDAIRRFYASLIERFPRFAHAFSASAIVVARSGDLAVVQGTYRFTPDTAAPEQHHTGKFVGVWQYRDGDWRLVVNISNADPAATTDS